MMVKFTDVLNYQKGKYLSRFCTIIALLKILFFSFNAFAQDRNLKFEHLTTKDGLSQSTITCILQDSKGFMWFGTQDGLNKYDGYNFTIFRRDPDNPASIKGSFVFEIIEDSKGNLWIGTESGLNLFDRANNGFVHYQRDVNDPNSLIGNEVRAVFEDSRYNLWIGTTGGGLNLFDRDNEKFIHYHHNESDPNSLSSNDIYSVYEDNRKNLWIGSMQGDLDLFDRENKVFHHYYYKNKKLSNNEIWNITGDRDSNLWICSYRSGLYKLSFPDNGESEFTHYMHDDNDVNSISGNAIFTVFEDSKERLWVGTENEGLNLFDEENNKFIHYRSDPFNDNSLNNNSIWSIYEDNTGNLWIGTHAGGINMIPRYGGNFSHYKHNPGDINSLSHNSVTCFYEDSRHNFWIGTDGGGLNLFNRKSETFIHYDRQNSNLSSDAVLSVFEDSSGNLWIGTWEGGLNLFDRGHRNFIQYTKENSGLASNTIFSIHEDKRGVLWVGTFFGGISYYDRNRNTFISYTPENSNLSDENIRVITGDSYGNLWIGGALGLNMFIPESKMFFLYAHNESDDKSLSGGYVLSILEASDSILWIGTAEGLNKFDRKSQNFIQYHLKDGLPSDAIKGIREDEEGNLWLSTNKGLSRFNPETRKFKNYDVSDGLQDNEFYQCSHYKSESGEIFFGGVNGFNSFNPKDLIDNSYIPPVIITDFLIFNKPVGIGKNSPLQTHISEAGEIRLSYRQSVISFEFAALNYISSKKNQYAYRLDAFDKDWNYVGAKNTATYTNLDPGEYTFRVKGSNNDGIWNEEGTSVKVIITPPFWQTWWFRSITLSLVVMILFLIYYLKVSQIRRRNIILESLVKERTREINEKNTILIEQTEELNNTNTQLEERQQQIEEQTDELKAQRDQLSEANSIKDKLFSIIAHDLRSPFNTLKGFIDLVQSRYDTYSDKERKNMISIIVNSAGNVYNLIDNLLNWSRSQQGAIHFVPEMANIIDIINENIELFNDQAVNKDIKIESKSAAEDIRLMIDKEMINIVIRNLLANAIKYTNVDGKIELNCKRENNNVIISVKDDGIGISEENKEKLFRNDIHFSSRGTKNETGTGLGLLLCKELIEKHQGKIWIESEQNLGTAIFISLPVKETGTDMS
jgi:ligand-binding sensor domain-containing protein/signal transduction histidine kinase